MYNVRAEMQGFRSQTVTDLKVETQQKARVDFVLEVGNVTETVEVVASTPSWKQKTRQSARSSRTSVWSTFR